MSGNGRGQKGTLLAVLAVYLLCAPQVARSQTVLSDIKVPLPTENTEAGDRFVARAPGEPQHPAAGTWGLDKATGEFRHPAQTPFMPGMVSWDGQLNYLDQNQYALNTKVEAFYPHVVVPNHTWQSVFDFRGRRYMYHYYRNAYKAYDITDSRKVEVIADKVLDTRGGDRPFGPMAVRYSRALGKTIAVQCYEVPRFGLVNNKYLEPEKVKALRGMKMLRGFSIYEVTGPLFADWKLLSETTHDPKKTASDPVQEGSGCLDVPYFNEKYLFVAAAPDDTFSNTEYTSVLWSAAQLAYDISNPEQPKLLSTWWVPGQRAGEEAELKSNPRTGNRASWLGARMPLAIPRATEDGGRYGYAPMGGLGMHVVDISDPHNMRAVGHVDLPVSVAGTEGDNIDVTHVERTGLVFFSGYPLNDDCYEPYKDIYAIDVRDAAHPKLAGVLPRPKPPKEALFTDYCQRRGSFGPKRTGYWTNTGRPSDKYLIYAFYNAGMQMFDISNPEKPVISAYFVPKMIDAQMALPKGNNHAVPPPAHGVFIEWDRNIVWVFTNHGFYAISSPLLGEPLFSVPKQ